jgi:hypothetical protein
MNNERYEQIIDEAYKNYQKYPLATRYDHRTNLLYKNSHKGWCMLNGRSMISPHPTRQLTKEEIINKCKIDSEFSQEFGLKIEERELSLEERTQLARGKVVPLLGSKEDSYNEAGIPTKLITLTYNNETIESYE